MSRICDRAARPRSPGEDSAIRTMTPCSQWSRDCTRPRQACSGTGTGAQNASIRDRLLGPRDRPLHACCCASAGRGLRGRSRQPPSGTVAWRRQLHVGTAKRGSIPWVRGRPPPFPQKSRNRKGQESVPIRRTAVTLRGLEGTRRSPTSRHAHDHARMLSGPQMLPRLGGYACGAACGTTGPLPNTVSVDFPTLYAQRYRRFPEFGTDLHSRPDTRGAYRYLAQ